MALKDLIAERIARLESIPDNLINTTGRIQQDILTEIIVLLDSLDKKGDKILLSTANIEKIEVISNRMVDVVFETDYTRALVEFASEFNVQGVLNREILAEISGVKFANKDIFQSILRKSQTDAISLLSGEAVQAHFVDPMKQILTDSVSSGASFRDTVNQLRDYITGTDELDGTLQRYVKQVARDGFNIADRRYTEVISEDLGFEWFRYAGGTVRDSRLFCIDRVGKIFHKTEIEGWGSGLGVGEAGVPWQGMFRGTNSNNIFSLLGGYNCMHALIPVSDTAVPEERKEEIRRAA